MKNILLVLSMSCLSLFGLSQGSQDFENAGLTGSYLDGDFTESGITYSYTHCRDQGDFNITDLGLMLRRASDSYFEWTIPNGIGNLSFDYRKAFTGGSIRQLEVYVNGDVAFTTDEFGEGSGEQTDVYTFNEDIDAEGSVTIKIKNVGETTTGRQAVIDNIEWTAFAGGSSIEYCIPIYSYGCVDGYEIEDFVLMGHNGSSIEDLGTGCSTDGYDDRTEIVTPVDLLQGETYNYQVKTNASGVGAAVWIDFNNDGEFTFTEMVSYGPLTNGVLSTITAYSGIIPVNATPGLHRMRVSVTNNIPNDPCGNYFTWGETHDYMVNIVALGGCTGTPEAGTVSNINVCAGFTFDLSTDGASTGETGLLYQWEQSTDGSNWTDVAGANTVSHTMANGVTETTYFRLVVTCDNSGETATSEAIEVTIENGDCYCIPVATNSQHYIDNFSTTGGQVNVTNTGTGFSYQGYGDFSGMNIEQERNEAISFEADIVGGTYGFKIWVDWNQDGEFSSNEVAYSSQVFLESHTGTFVVPSDAVSGATRMRIVCDWNTSTADIDPCETAFGFGEFEDYTVYVIEETDCSNFEASIDGETEICEEESTTLSVTATANIESVEWNTNDTGTEITVSESGTYTATVTSEDGCEYVVSAEVNVTLFPTVGEVTVIENGNGTYIFAPVDAANVDEYVWDFGDGETSTETNPTHTYGEEGTYTVTLTVSNDCDSASVTATVVYGVSGINENDLIELNVFPNPTNKYLNIFNESSFDMESIVIVSPIGQVVFNNKVISNEFKFDVSQFATGLYHVNIILNNGNIVQRKFAVIN